MSLVSHFSVEQLEQALDERDAHTPVYAEVRREGRVCGVRGAELAHVVLSARLAPSAPAATARLHLLPRARLQLRVLVTAAPGPALADLALWFDEAALGALDMAVLAPHHIRHTHYQCHACSRAFSDPNPLKVHLFMRCEPADPPRFWREVAARLRTARAPADPPGPAAPLGLPPAQLEALAAEWGRSRAGHACVYCGKLYSRRYGLKIHLRTHTGYRPLRCGYCQRAFGDPSNLNKHVRLHRARLALPDPQIKDAPCV